MAKKKMKIPARAGKSPKKNKQNMLRQQLMDMQEQLLEAQQEFEEKEFEASSGGGYVKVVMKGNHELSSITIDPEVVDEDDMEMLEDMVLTAINEAVRLVKAESEAMTQPAGAGLPGMDLPDLSGLF